MMASHAELRVNPTRLLIERARRGLSQKDLADACGLAHSTINRIEAGRAPVQARTIYRIALVLGVDVELLGEPVSTGAADRSRTPLSAALPELRRPGAAGEARTG
jgi:transcriptional regulator with XRE-family HTH domain